MTYVAQRKDNGKVVQGFVFMRDNTAYIIPTDEYFVEEVKAGDFRLLNLTAFVVDETTLEALPW